MITTYAELEAKGDFATYLTPLYGLCPACGAAGAERERRPNGNDTCVNGHTYPSAHAVSPYRDVSDDSR